MTAIKGFYESSPSTVAASKYKTVQIDNQGRLVVVGAGSGGTSVAAGTYNTSPPTLTNGATSSEQLDVNGNLKVVEQYAPVAEDNTNGVIAMINRPVITPLYAPTPFVNFGTDVTKNVKTTSALLFSMTCQNSNAAIRFLQLHNTATTPAGGAVPILSFTVPANGTIIVDEGFFTNRGLYFSLGIAFAFSTTVGTYTAGTAADQNTQLLYK